MPSASSPLGIKHGAGSGIRDISDIDLSALVIDDILVAMTHKALCLILNNSVLNLGRVGIIYPGDMTRLEFPWYSDMIIIKGAFCF